MNRKQKRALLRILLSGALLLAAAYVPIADARLSLLPFLAAYGIVGFDVLRTAAQNILHGQVFDENFLMSVATVGAFALGKPGEAVAVMLLYQVGELFQSIAVGKSRRSIAALMDIRPDSACAVRGGAELTVPPEEVAVGETIVVHPGERIPLDGVVENGAAHLDTAALTGESVPRYASAGMEVFSGSIDLDGVLRVRVTHGSAESTVSRILDLVENASANKAKAEHFITRFARWYTPAVVIAALLLALVPPFFDGMWRAWIERALVFLVISCPCALVISVPLTFFGGIGRASRRGILVKGSNYLEALARADTVVFDKTGTLTEGRFAVRSAVPAPGETAERLLLLAAAAERHSTHPIARSLCEACAQARASAVSDVAEYAGEGVCALVDGCAVAVGNGRLMARIGIPLPHAADAGGTFVYAAADGAYLGYIVIADAVKPGAAEAVGRLRALGVRRIAMLTGDARAAADAVKDALGLDSAIAELLPDGKVAAVETMLSEPERRGNLLFVGDGINDAPVLSRADVGVAMGALGADAAIEAADIVLMDDRPEKLAEAIRIARRTHTIVTENIAFALGVKGVVLLLGALGRADLWGAVFSDVGVCIIAVLNAMRMLLPNADNGGKR